MYKIALPLLAIIALLSIDAQAQGRGNIFTAPQPKSQGVIYNDITPYCGVKLKERVYEFSQKDLNEINPDWIKSMDVYKGAKAVELYGKKAKDGAIIITIKEENELEALDLLKIKKE